MWLFFRSWKWALWAWGGAAVIVASLWYQVQVNVKINEWFGSFYDLIQKALAAPGSIEANSYWSLMWEFGTIAGVFIIIAVATDYFTQHWVFRWRQSMNHFYVDSWDKIHHVEGASQRVQEDTKRFAQLIETLGVNFVRAVMTLIAFVPILWNLSKGIEFYGIPHVLVIGAIGFALVGTIGLALLGIKLPGLEYNNQVVEAKYRKQLVHAEGQTKEDLTRKLEGCSDKLFPSILPLHVFRDGQMVIPPIRRISAIHNHGSHDHCRSDLIWRYAADRKGLQSSRKVTPVPSRKLDSSCRITISPQAIERIRRETE